MIPAGAPTQPQDNSIVPIMKKDCSTDVAGMYSRTVGGTGLVVADVVVAAAVGKIGLQQ